MITVANIRNINYAAYDEVWAIVRSLKNPGKLKQVTELSPSWKLFKTYLGLRDTGKWNTATFQDIYVPVFLQEMHTVTAHKKLKELIELDRQGKHICLSCFCQDEEMCHRSIIAGILQHIGIPIQGVKGDYSKYGRAFTGESEVKRPDNYRIRSLKQLIEGYAHEVGRKNESDKEITQRLIRNEVYARIKATFTMLDEDPDAVGQIYKQLIEH